MRFSIAFIVVLTLWAALGVQNFLWNQLHREYLAEEVSYRADIDATNQQIAQLESRGLELRHEQYTQELSGRERLLEDLTAAFRLRSEALGNVIPQDDMFSVRSIPVLPRLYIAEHRFKIYVPASRPISLKVEAKIKHAQKTDPLTDLPTLELSADMSGPPEWSTALAPGMHEVSVIYDYRQPDEDAIFSIAVDGQQLEKWVNIESRSRGFGASTTEWEEQANYKKTQRLPTLIKLSPGEMQTEMVVQLVDQVL